MTKINTTEIFDKDYMPYIVSRGKWCTRLVLLVAYLPVLVLLFYFDAHPTSDSIFTGMVSMLSILLPWYVVDPISLQSIFGVPGMYLSYMAGNTKEVRVPASTQAYELFQDKSLSKYFHNQFLTLYNIYYQHYLVHFSPIAY